MSIPVSTRSAKRSAAQAFLGSDTVQQVVGNVNSQTQQLEQQTQQKLNETAGGVTGGLHH